MKITVLSTVLLGCFMVMTVQGDSSARVAPAGKVGYKNKLGGSAQEESFVRSGAGHVRKIGVGGKKLSRKEEKYVDFENGKRADGETSKISGATYSDGICDFDEREGDHKIVKCNDNDGLKPSGSRDQKNDPQDCNSAPPKSDLGSSSVLISLYAFFLSSSSRHLILIKRDYHSGSSFSESSEPL
ncbi:hypothetical protein VNO80_08120 [Phaseolus coccineus]|uniref:Uncharacterized protein n=1 Tax=Phaseolus coccineus TaxID=3886 RepID=A0AAN9NPZ5_PHACN